MARVSNFNDEAQMLRALAYQKRLYKKYKAYYNEAVKESKNTAIQMFGAGAASTITIASLITGTGGIFSIPAMVAQSVTPIVSGATLALLIKKGSNASKRATKWQNRMLQAAQQVAKINQSLAVIRRAKAEGKELGVATAEDEVGLGLRTTGAIVQNYLPLLGLAAVVVGFLVIRSNKKAA